MFVGWLSSTKFFSGRRISLIVASILFVTIWNILWVVVSDIQVNEQANYTENELKFFDIVMYRGEGAFTFLIYQLILISGPLDISKQHMLSCNQRIYAILFCLMGCIKLTI